MKTREQIQSEIQKLRADVVVATNSGTFGGEECRRCRGSGEPQYGEWRIVEKIDGTRITIGEPGGAPGYARWSTGDSASVRRGKIKALVSQMSTAPTAESQRAARIRDLKNGWCGGQYIGADRAAEIIRDMTSATG